MEDLSETLNKEKTKANQTERNNSITEIKTTLEGKNSGLEESEEQISGLEDRVMKSKQTEQERGKNKINEGSSVTPSSVIFTV